MAWAGEARMVAWAGGGALGGSVARMAWAGEGSVARMAAWAGEASEEAGGIRSEDWRCADKGVAAWRAKSGEATGLPTLPTKDDCTRLEAEETKIGCPSQEGGNGEPGREGIGSKRGREGMESKGGNGG